MTAKELAERLNGCEYGNEITSEERAAAIDAGLVVVFGYSDDNMELRGAINGEVDCYDGGIVGVSKDGIFAHANFKGMAESKQNSIRTLFDGAKVIEAVWCGEPDGPAWTYKTDIPHETFEVMEDGEVWCRGIVFSVEDLS